MKILSKLTVGDVFQPGPGPSLLVSPEDAFTDVIRRLAAQPELRGVFVVDPEQRLLGVITRADLLDWARIRLGAALRGPAPGREKTLRLAGLIRAVTAGQVMHADSQRAAVTAEKSLAEALRLMVELDLIVVPVVDEARLIVGELRLSDILARVVDADAEPQ